MFFRNYAPMPTRSFQCGLWDFTKSWPCSSGIDFRALFSASCCYKSWLNMSVSATRGAVQSDHCWTCVAACPGAPGPRGTRELQQPALGEQSFVG